MLASPWGVRGFALRSGASSPTSPSFPGPTSSAFASGPHPITAFGGHRGYFYNMMLLYTSYEEDLVAAVQEHPDYDLIFTGHSLGAAAASLAAADFLHRLRPQLRSELQGAPLRGEPLHGLPVLLGS